MNGGYLSVTPLLFMLKNEGEEQEHPEGLQEAEREQQREEESAGGLAETSGLNLLAYKPLFVLLAPPKATRGDPVWF